MDVKSHVHAKHRRSCGGARYLAQPSSWARIALKALSDCTDLTDRRQVQDVEIRLGNRWYFCNGISPMSESSYWLSFDRQFELRLSAHWSWCEGPVKAYACDQIGDGYDIIMTRGRRSHFVFGGYVLGLRKRESWER